MIRTDHRATTTTTTTTTTLPNNTTTNKDDGRSLRHQQRQIDKSAIVGLSMMRRQSHRRHRSSSPMLSPVSECHTFEEEEDDDDEEEASRGYVETRKDRSPSLSASSPSSSSFSGNTTKMTGPLSSTLSSTTPPSPPPTPPPQSPLSSPSSSAAAPLSSGTENDEDDDDGDDEAPLRRKYGAMLRVGLPHGAVLNAMERDGAVKNPTAFLDRLVLLQEGWGDDDDDDKGGGGGGAVGDGSDEEEDDENDGGGDDDDNGIPLKDTPEYGKYFKMLKAKVPLAWVKKVFEVDGRGDPSILELDPELPLSQKETKTKTKNKQRRRLPQTATTGGEEGGAGTSTLSAPASLPPLPPRPSVSGGPSSSSPAENGNIPPPSRAAMATAAASIASNRKKGASSTTPKDDNGRGDESDVSKKEVTDGGNDVDGADADAAAPSSSSPPPNRKEEAGGRGAKKKEGAAADVGNYPRHAGDGGLAGPWAAVTTSLGSGGGGGGRNDDDNGETSDGTSDNGRRQKSDDNEANREEDGRPSAALKRKDSPVQQDRALPQPRGDGDDADESSSPEEEAPKRSAQHRQGGEEEGSPMKTPSGAGEGGDETTNLASNGNDEAPSAALNNSHPRHEGGLPLRDDPEYSKYFQMLRARVPRKWIARVVLVDGKDPLILDLDPNLPLAVQLPKDDASEEEEGGDGDRDDNRNGDAVAPLVPPAAPSVPCAPGIVEDSAGSSSATHNAPAGGSIPNASRPLSVLAAGPQLDSATDESSPTEQATAVGPQHITASGDDRQRQRPPSFGSASELNGRSGAGHAKLSALFAARAAPTDDDGGPRSSQSHSAIPSPSTTAAQNADTLSGRSGAGKANVAALFAARAAQDGTTSGRPAVRSKEAELSGMSGASNSNVAALFAARAAQSGATSRRPALHSDEAESSGRSDAGKANVAALFATRAAQDGTTSGQPGGNSNGSKITQKSNAKLSALFAARSRTTGRRVGTSPLHGATVPSAEDPIGSASEAAIDDDRPALKDEPEYAKYFKMLSVGLPLGAVKNSMQRDGKNPDIADLDPTKSLASQLQTKNDANNDGPPLEDDPEFAKYFKMLKVGLPVGAVKNSMQKDGKDPTVLDLDPEKSLASQKGNEPTAAKKEAQKKKPKVVRKRLFWKSIDESKLDRGSLWAQARSESSLSLEGLEYDTDEFASLFTSKGNSANAKKKPSTSLSAQQAKAQRQKVQLVDSRRQMNGSILLAKFSQDYETLAKSVDRMDPGEMNETAVRALQQLLPTKDECLALRSYLPPSNCPPSVRKDAISKLGECEKYMAAMLDIVDAPKKFECMLFRVQFEDRVKELTKETDSLIEACNAVRHSDRLKRLLVYALRLGNTLNTGAAGEKVAGITLDSLLKLHEAKGFDKKTSVLHFLVTIIQKNDGDVLCVGDDLTSAKQAERITMDALANALTELSEGLALVKDTVHKQTASGSGVEIKSQRSILPAGDESLRMTSMGRFALDADAQLLCVTCRLDVAKEKYADLLTYFGEDEDKPADEFFKTLNRFISLLESAREDMRRKENAKARKERMAERRQSRSSLEEKAGDESLTPLQSRAKLLDELVKFQFKPQGEEKEEATMSAQTSS